VETDITQRELQLLTTILGLEGEQVADAVVAPEVGRLDLMLVEPEAPYICPHCSREHAAAHDRRQRAIRDKPWADLEVYIHVTQVRIRCCRGRTPIEIESSAWVKKNAATANDSAR
jgi:transposase